MRGRLRAAAAALAACAVLPLAAAELTERQRLEDFDAMWRAIDARYAFFDAGHGAWRRARDTWRPRAAKARASRQFAAVLRATLDTLEDDNVALAAEELSRARVPYDIDIWPRWEAGAARVEAVRVFSDADVAGMRPGQPLADSAVEGAMRERLGRRPRDAAQAEWALRRVFAERNHRTPSATPPLPALSAHRIGENRDLGYVKVRIGVPEPQLEQKLDTALDQLSDTRALIVDLRDNAGPGSPALTRTVLARFVRQPTPWQLRSNPQAKPAADSIAPAGVAYTGPVVVLVDRWTAGEGETLAQGLKTVAHAQLIGTRTAGLRGATTEVRLPRSGFVVSFPVERTFQLDGKPRRELVPDILIDLAAPKGGPGDPILYQALTRLQSSSAPARRSAPR